MGVLLKRYVKQKKLLLIISLMYARKILDLSNEVK